jgi:hypothetical protein
MNANEVGRRSVKNKFEEKKYKFHTGENIIK